MTTQDRDRNDVARVVSVSRDGSHRFSKQRAETIRLLVGLGIEGDAHLGRTVQHLSRVRRDPDQPNLRQVHLMQAGLHDELNAQGFEIVPGALGENITTRGIDLLGLPTGTTLLVGADAAIQVTGLRNPCLQIENYRRGLLARVAGRDEDGRVERRAGVMAVVLTTGSVTAGDSVRIVLPDPPYSPLVPV